MARYWYQTCPVCQKGRLFVEKRTDGDAAGGGDSAGGGAGGGGAGELFLECEQCYTSWNSPEDLGQPGFGGIGIISDYASSEDMRRAGWSKYPFQVALDAQWPGS